MSSATMSRKILLKDVVQNCNSWNDFRNNLSGLTNKQKGDLFEELVKAYLKLAPEYKTTLDEVWLYREIPHSIRTFLNLPSVDKGVDLITKTKDGKFWAVQCKYRENTDVVLHWESEISTFAGSMHLCKNVYFGLLCSTTYKPNSILKRQDRIGLCSLDVWEGLDKEFFDRLRAEQDNKAVVYDKRTPRPNQIDAINDAYSHFSKGNRRGKMIMPCATGKSLTAYWISQKLGAKKILVAVPSLFLIQQSLRDWIRESVADGSSARWICVCGDESVVDKEEVSIQTIDLAIPCITDSIEIADWLKIKHDGISVVFTTYQSGAALSKAARMAGIKFDIGIMDEAHKTVGDKYKLFSHLLFDKNVEIEHRIFMTATERRFRGEKSNKILSMDDVNVYGEAFHVLTVARSYKYNPPILCPYTVKFLGVSKEQVSETAKQIKKNEYVTPDKGSWEQEIEAKDLASIIAIRKAIKQHNIKHVVSYHGSIRRAKTFNAISNNYNDVFPQEGIVSGFHVSGELPTGERKKIINEFKSSDISLVTNARCLTEGVDVPNIDCVVFVDPRNSKVDIVQAAGRAMRPDKNKKHAYIIVPVLMDGADSSAFRTVLSVLSALAANDERIIQWLKAKTEGKQHSIAPLEKEGDNKSAEFPAEDSLIDMGSVTNDAVVEFDLDECISKKIDIEKFKRELELVSYERVAKLSWMSFERAREFVQSLNLSSVEAWQDYTKSEKRQKDIPARPDHVYAGKGWKDYEDWLGNSFLPFLEAREFARKLKFNGQKEWTEYSKSGKRPKDIPGNPSNTYEGKGWRSFGDWLGTARIDPRYMKFLPFTKARKFVRNLNLRGDIEWKKYCNSGKRPKNIPSNPSSSYANEGWRGLSDWLGSGRISPGEYRPFIEARSFVRKLRLNSSSAWRTYCNNGKRPRDIPSNPQKAYANNGWRGMGDWLGTGTVRTRDRVYLTFNEARICVHKLKIKNQHDWVNYCKGRKLPKDIPASPWNIYANKGWKNLGDWLGNGKE